MWKSPLCSRLNPFPLHSNGPRKNNPLAATTSSSSLFLLADVKRLRRKRSALGGVDFASEFVAPFGRKYISDLAGPSLFIARFSYTPPGNVVALFFYYFASDTFVIFVSRRVHRSLFSV